MTTFSTILFLILLTCTDSFHAGCYNYGVYASSRSRNSVSPMFYKEIEPEISSATTNRPMISFNYTASLLSYNSEQIVDGGQLADKVTVRGDSSRSKSKSRSRSIPSTKAKQPHEVTWRKHYNELILYESEHGHCLVPQNFKPNQKLGLWVMQQRRQYTLQQNGKKSSLNAMVGKKRIALLEDIGFVWRVERRGPRGAYGELRRMRQSVTDADDDGDGSDDILDAVDFEKLMIEKREVYSEREMRAAWRRRFEIFQ